MFPLSGLIDQANTPAAEPVELPPPVFAPKPGPGARNVAAQAQVERELQATPFEYDESNAPDFVTTAQRLTGETDPYRVGRVAAVLERYGKGQQVDPPGRLGATQSDWAKFNHLVKAGLVSDTSIASKYQMMADLSDDEAQEVSEFVRRVGDMTQDVYSKDWKMDGGAEVYEVESSAEGPVIHLRQHQAKAPAMRSARKSMPTRMPYIAGGQGGAFVLPSGEVGFVEKPDHDQLRHLHPMAIREDGFALWAPKETLQVSDTQRMIDHATLELENPPVERWSVQAFGRMHPAKRAATTVMVDVPDGMPLKRLRALGEIVDPGQAAVVMYTDEDGDRKGGRARRIGIVVPDDVEAKSVVAEAGLWGGKPVAVYSSTAISGMVPARERLVTDGVTTALIRHSVLSYEPADVNVWVPEEAPTSPQFSTPGYLLPDLSAWVSSLKKEKGRYVVEADPMDLLPAASAAHALCRVGLDAVLQTVHKDRKVRLELK